MVSNLIKCSIEKFFFDQYYLIIFRSFIIAFTLSFLIYFFSWFLDGNEWLSHSGFHVDEKYEEVFNQPIFPLLPQESVLFFGGFVLLVSIGLIYDILPRICSISLTIICIYLDGVDLIASFTLNKLYIFGFLTIWVAYVFDAIPQGITNYKGKMQVWPIRLFQITFVCQYFLAGFCKLIHGDWVTQPHALWSFLQGVYKTEFASWMLRTLPKDLFVFQLYFFLLLELSTPVWVCFKKYRPVGFLLAGFGHIMIALTMHQLIYFSLQMMTFYILFLDVNTIKLIDKKLKRTIYFRD